MTSSDAVTSVFHDTLYLSNLLVKCIDLKSWYISKLWCRDLLFIECIKCSIGFTGNSFRCSSALCLFLYFPVYACGTRVCILEISARCLLKVHVYLAKPIIHSLCVLTTRDYFKKNCFQTFTGMTVTTPFAKWNEGPHSALVCVCVCVCINVCVGVCLCAYVCASNWVGQFPRIFWL